METVAGLVKDDRGRGLKHLFRHLDTGREFRMRGDHGLTHLCFRVVVRGKISV